MAKVVSTGTPYTLSVVAYVMWRHVCNALWLL